MRKYIVTNILSKVYLPNDEIATDGVITLKLNTNIVFEGKVFTTAPVSFPIINQMIDIQVVPNETASPVDNFYHVYINIGALVYTTKWFVRNVAYQKFDTLIPYGGTPPVILETDPRIQALLEDTTPEDGVPDIAQQVRWCEETIDSELFNGVTDSFSTTRSYTGGTLVVILNGVRLNLNLYSEININTFLLVEPPVPEDTIVVQYYGL